MSKEKFEKSQLPEEQAENVKGGVAPELADVETPECYKFSCVLSADKKTDVTQKFPTQASCEGSGNIWRSERIPCPN